MGELAIVIPFALMLLALGYVVQITRDLHRLAATMERIEARLVQSAPLTPAASIDPDLPPPSGQ